MNEQTQNLLRERMAGAKTLEPINISNTVHSWLNMLNRVIDICSVVDYPLPPDKAKYANLFGFMTSEDKYYLDGLKTGITPLPNFKGIDISAAGIESVRSFSKAVHRTVDSSIPDNSATVKVERASADVTCVDAFSNVFIEAIAYPDPTYYAVKTVSVKAEEDIQIEYAGSGFTFVNNSVYPNIGYSEIGTQRRTLLLKGNFIVYRLTFIHSRVMIEVAENTQLLDNYLAPSANAADPSLNGTVEFYAKRSALAAASELAAQGSPAWFNADGTVSDEMDGERAALGIETEIDDTAGASWGSVTMGCTAVIGGQSIRCPDAEIEDGRRIAQFWAEDGSACVKIEYSLNSAARRLSFIGATVVKTSSGRTYDE